MPVNIPIGTLEKFTTFGDLLRFLRRHVGLTQMELADAVGYSDGQISRLEQNLRLPDIPIIEARFVSALGLENEPKAVARLLELAANVRREDAPARGLCPYKGLSYFDEVDADLFVGRESLTSKLVERVLSLTSDSLPRHLRFLAIVGASGSGKSSLVRAGVVSALRWTQQSVDWQIYILTPTAYPLESLAMSVTQVDHAGITTTTLMDELAHDTRNLTLFIKRKVQSEHGSCVLLVVDQFEELFSLCRSEEERKAFIDNLLIAASEVDTPITVVITLRADFYAHCATYPELREALAEHQEYIGVMNNDELRRAIEEPARRGRWELEPGLVDLLLRDVGSEPGALPLLSHALLETWLRRRGRLMTLSGYASSGGVRGAIAETAETVFSDQFTHEQQIIARRIFLRLTELGDESVTADTRRRAMFSELILKPEEAAATHSVLKALADARLIMTGENSAEVAHEALIREWPTLRGWLEENREGLRLHRQLTDAAHEWSSMNRESDLLFRGARLAHVREWAEQYREDLNALEHEFLNASIEQSEREVLEREAQRQRELEAAQILAETEQQRAEAERQRAEEQTRSASQLRKRALYLTGAFIIALLMALTALFFGESAHQSAVNAQTASHIAISRELAAAAITNLDADPERSILLALQAEKASDTLEAENALHRSILASRVVLTVHHDGEVWSVAYSPDGNRFATASRDKTAKVWDASTGELLLTLSGHTKSVGGVAFSPDGQWIATSSDDHTAMVWDAVTGKERFTLSGHTDSVWRVAYTPDGKRLATVSRDGSARMWDAGTGKQLFVMQYTDPLLALAFAPDGTRLATTTEDAKDAKVIIWDASNGKQLLLLSLGSPAVLTSVAFSPDGKRVAVTGDGAPAVKMWDAHTGAELLESDLGVSNLSYGIAFSPDHKTAAVSGLNHKVTIWDPLTGQVLFTLTGHTHGVNGIAFSPDGKHLASASLDGTARIWDLTPTTEALLIPVHGGSPRVTYSPDGTRILSGDADEKAAKIWDATSGKELLVLNNPMTQDYFSTAYSPDGKMVAAGNDENTITVWDAKTGEQIHVLSGHTDFVYGLAFSPDGTRLISGSYDNTAIIWDLETGKALLTLKGGGATDNGIPSVAFSPDGTHVVTGDFYGKGMVWDAATGAKLLSLSGHTDTIWGIGYSPDGKRIATSSRDGTCKIWDAVTGKELLTLRGHTGTVISITFSPDGKRVASSSIDGFVKIWDATTGENLLTLQVDNNGIAGVSFSSDGKRLAVVANSGIQILLLPIQDVIELAKSRVTRDLTTEECQQYLHVDICPGGP
jgi:WD40 repeat protein/transcriptional regulator with XRE-family HTH domain